MSVSCAMCHDSFTETSDYAWVLWLFFSSWHTFFQMVCSLLQIELMIYHILLSFSTVLWELSLVIFMKGLTNALFLNILFLWRFLLWKLVEELYVTCHRTIIKRFEQVEIHWLLYLLHCVCWLCEWKHISQLLSICIATISDVFKELQHFLLVWTVCRTQTTTVLVSSEFIHLVTEWNTLYIT